MCYEIISQLGCMCISICDKLVQLVVLFSITKFVHKNGDIKRYFWL